MQSYHNYNTEYNPSAVCLGIMIIKAMMYKVYRKIFSNVFNSKPSTYVELAILNSVRQMSYKTVWVIKQWQNRKCSQVMDWQMLHDRLDAKQAL